MEFVWITQVTYDSSRFEQVILSLCVLRDDSYKVIAHNVSRAKAAFGHTIAILLSRIFSVLNSERIAWAGCSSICVAVVIVRQSGAWNEYANNNMQTSTTGCEEKMEGCFGRENKRKRCRIQLTFETRSGQQRRNNPYLSMNAICLNMKSTLGKVYCW